MLYLMDGSHYCGETFSDLWDRDHPQSIFTTGYGTQKLVPDAAIWKATEGLQYSGGSWWSDWTYEENIKAIRAAGLPTGSYHYYRQMYDSKRQAEWYYYFVSSFPATDLPPVLDVEVINNPYLSVSDIWSCIYHIERLFKRPCMIYTGFYVWRDHVRKGKTEAAKQASVDWAKEKLLWLASYRKQPLIPYPWTGWTLWQFSDSKGDEQWFNGDREALDKLIHDTYIQPFVSLPSKPTVVDNVKEVVKKAKSKITKKARKPG